MAYILLYKGVVHYMNHRKNKAETFAFLFSILALTIISYPRITLLYAYRAYTRVGLIVKVVGAQWYWAYEISDLFEDEVYMYILPLDEIRVGEKRFLVALPTLGAKVDAVAGLHTSPRLSGKDRIYPVTGCVPVLGHNLPTTIEVGAFYWRCELREILVSSGYMHLGRVLLRHADVFGLQGVVSLHYWLHLSGRWVLVAHVIPPVSMHASLNRTADSGSVG